MATRAASASRERPMERTVARASLSTDGTRKEGAKSRWSIDMPRSTSDGDGDGDGAGEGDDTYPH
jgi:hypothetical protein